MGFVRVSHHRQPPIQAGWERMGYDGKAAYVDTGNGNSKRELHQIGGMLETLVTSEDTLLFYKLCFFFPVCAVSGYGAVTTSSDRNESGRLTAVYNSNTPTYYECSKLLYKDLLSYGDRMSYEHRKSIKKRLVSAHLKLAVFF